MNLHVHHGGRWSAVRHLAQCFGMKSSGLNFDMRVSIPTLYDCCNSFLLHRHNMPRLTSQDTGLNVLHATRKNGRARSLRVVVNHSLIHYLGCNLQLTPQEESYNCNPEQQDLVMRRCEDDPNQDAKLNDMRSTNRVTQNWTSSNLRRERPSQ